MSKIEDFECPHCHASSTAYWFTITPGLVGALVKFRRAVIRKGINSVHTRHDMDGTANELTKGEYVNWTILRFHGLVAKHKDAGPGYWLLTHRGAEFLKGDLAIPQKVKTLNNHVVDHSDVHVVIEDVIGTRPVFEDITIIEREPQPLGAGQLSLL